MVFEKDFRIDMETMQRLFKAVEHGYNLYFAGVLKEAPVVDRTRLDHLVSTYRNAGLNKVSQRFLFNSFMNKYVIHSEQWNRWLQDRESGLVDDPRLSASVLKARREWRKLEKPEINNGRKEEEKHSEGKKDAQIKRKKAGQAARSGMRPLYDAYINACLKCGTVPKWDYGGFERYVSKQKSAIKGKYDCKNVTFRVAVRSGKVTLKARMQKHIV